jgi:hypothetical protein
MDNGNLWIFLHPPRTGGNTITETLLKKFPREEIFLPSVSRYQKSTKEMNSSKIRFMLGHATYYGIHKMVPDKKPRYFTILRNPADRIISHYNAKMQNEKEKISFDEWYKNQIKNEMVHFLNLKYKGSESSRIHIPKIFSPIIRIIPFANKAVYEGYKIQDLLVKSDKKISYKMIYLLQTLLFKIFWFNKSNQKNDRKKLENAKKLLDLCWFVGITEKSNQDFKFLLKALGVKNPKWVDDGISKKIIKIDDKSRKKIYDENKLDIELYNYALNLRKKFYLKQGIKSS